MAARRGAHGDDADRLGAARTRDRAAAPRLPLRRIRGRGGGARRAADLKRAALSYRDGGNFREYRATILDNLRDAPALVLRRLMPSRDAVARDCHRFLGQLARPVLRFTSEAHGVMSARLVLFASGAPDAAS